MTPRTEPQPTHTFRGDAMDRLEERDRFLRGHGAHGLRWVDGDEEFGTFDGLACDVHEAELQLIPPVEPQPTSSNGRVGSEPGLEDEIAEIVASELFDRLMPGYGTIDAPQYRGTEIAVKAYRGHGASVARKVMARIEQEAAALSPEPTPMDGRAIYDAFNAVDHEEGGHWGLAWDDQPPDVQRRWSKLAARLSEPPKP